MTRHQKRMLKQAAKQICLHILFIVICFVTLIPILYALSVSLNADNSLVSSDFRFIPKNFTLRNYVAVFTEEPVMLWFKNSMTLAVVTVVISLAAAIPAAYAFSRMRFKGRKRHPACHAHRSSAGAPQYFGYGGYDLDLCLE